ncbi:hypothetical protein UA08_09099 [Talaromyces atroroseus]|uniref:Uncharacterized protein n=1 Tax=Talaromyces atroroseus TaxID=1441469 RepID=A0A1Q5Q716_TALAT|nr:hypothetical protein UA08_09099 [Talaromyces atroroseus]OKL55636.1 hypothetical protein UA08_09099 [Talaromyces atroroseus]
MTEPEDLEEDLFADLYDGNDTNPATTTGVTDNSAEESAAYQANDVQNGRGPEDFNENPVIDLYQGQDAEGAQSSQGRDFTQGIGVHTGDVTSSTDAETQGTGIKEDGTPGVFADYIFAVYTLGFSFYVEYGSLVAVYQGGSPVFDRSEQQIDDSTVREYTKSIENLLSATAIY